MYQAADVQETEIKTERVRVRSGGGLLSTGNNRNLGAGLVQLLFYLSGCVGRRMEILGTWNKAQNQCHAELMCAYWFGHACICEGKCMNRSGSYLSGFC